MTVLDNNFKPTHIEVDVTVVDTIVPGVAESLFGSQVMGTTWEPGIKDDPEYVVVIASSLKILPKGFCLLHAATEDYGNTYK